MASQTINHNQSASVPPIWPENIPQKGKEKNGGKNFSSLKKNKIKVKKSYYKLTLSQLKKWKVNYHELILYKPSYDLFIDDKAYGFKKNWQKNFSNILKKI